MQLSKPVRMPLTIVGIVSNVVALTLVCVLLYAVPQFTLPKLQLVTDSISEIAKTRKVTPDDFIKLLGRPSEKFDGMANSWGWQGRWHEAVGDGLLLGNMDFMVSIRPNSTGNYLVTYTVNQTYRCGLKYFGWNLVRAFNTGSFFPFEPFQVNERQEMELTAQK